MRVVLIIVPIPTCDNYKAASALSYHLMKYREQDIDITAYSFNSNDVEQNAIDGIACELHIKINLISLPWWYKRAFAWHLTVLFKLLPYPPLYYARFPKAVLNSIKESQPDAVWIYGDNLSQIASQFDGFKRVMTLPDCVPLYYLRALADGFVKSSLLRNLGFRIQYYKNSRLERGYPTDKNIHYHLVGEEDRKFLKSLNPNLQVHFIHHPHYDVTDEKQIQFSKPKIKLLITGKYDIYTHTAFDELLKTLVEHPELAEYYELTFLGKDWADGVTQLTENGYQVKSIGFVERYLDEITKHDIQLVPISVGTGTKGKVLDAMANGLMVVGTPYAMENIAAVHNESCIVYNTQEVLLNVLLDIPHNCGKYEEMARKGRESVRQIHDRSIISKRFFDLMR